VGRRKRVVVEKKKNLALKRGKGFEYRVRDWFRRAGYEAERVPVSGVSKAMKGDVIVKVGDSVFCFECKRRTGGYKELFRWIEEARGKGLHAVILGVGRQKPVVVLQIDTFIELLGRRG
jgi:hypothetical protein